MINLYQLSFFVADLAVTEKHDLAVREAITVSVFRIRISNLGEVKAFSISSKYHLATFRRIVECRHVLPACLFGVQLPELNVTSLHLSNGSTV